jgi:hypothetical protein
MLISSSKNNFQKGDTMLGRFNRWTQLPMILTVTLTICIAQPGSAYESWTGVLSSNINVRKAPGLHGEIITGLKKNSLVSILKEQGEWYQVAIEEDAYGYRGWIYGSYVTRHETALKNNEPRLPEETVVVVPQVPPVTETSQPPEAKFIEPVMALETQSPLDTSTQNPQLDLALPPPEVSVDNNFARDDARLDMNPTAKTSPVVTHRALPQESVIPVVTKELSRIDLSHHQLQPTDIDVLKPIAGLQPQAFSTPDVMLDSEGPYGLIRLLLKFSTALFSCLALIFSYRSIQLAKINSKMIMALRHRERIGNLNHSI